MFNKRSCFASLLLWGLVASASAEVRLSSPHQPMMETQRNELVRSCIEAVRDHWGDAGLVLKQQARQGRTADGARVISVSGTVWQDGERVEVFHQCSQKPGSQVIALYVESATTVAGIGRSSD